MSLLGGITDLIFGKPKAPKADIGEITKILQLGDLYNNPNINTMFGGWKQEIGPDGRLTQSQYVDPKFQPGVDAFTDRFNEGTEDASMQALKAARFESMMGPRGAQGMPERRPPPPPRERSPNRSQYTDEDGNSIAPPDWWRTGRGVSGLAGAMQDAYRRR
jgi:hypothetical protein